MKHSYIFIHLVLYVFILFGFVGSLSLALRQFVEGDICPQLLFIPACYIIFGCFLGLLFLHLFKQKKIYFYVLAGFPIAIALYGSISQILGHVECPKTDNGIPMCFISLGLFTSIVLLKRFIIIKQDD